MRCSLRSTRLFASTVLALLLATAPVFSGAAPPAAVADAITRAVQLRMGADVLVVVAALDGLRLTGAPTALLAVPEPASQLGGPVRFVLSDATPGRAPARIGEAVARLDVSVSAVHATRPIARGEALTAADVKLVTTRLGRHPLRPVLALDEALEGRAARDISADVVLTRADVVPAPLVHAGDVVRAHANVGGVEVTGEMVAAESGRRDDTIRVFNQETRHAVRARIVARGEVEVVHVR